MFLDSLKVSLKKKPTAEGWWTTIMILIAFTFIAYALFVLAAGKTNVSLVYILALIAVAQYTDGVYYGVFASLVGVVCVNFWFTYPYWSVNFTLTGYPVTFLFMMATSLIVTMFTSHLKEQNQIIADREKALAEAEREKLRANLLRAVSHDLRTPLTTIIGFSDSYLEEESLLTEQEKRELVSQISDDSHWLLNMVENLLSVTKIQASATELNKTPELAEEVMEESISRLRKRLPNIQVTAQFPDVPLFVPMDPMLIEQVLMNLIENAYYHSGTTSPVICKVEEAKDHILFRVTDFGTGIDPDRIPNIFDGTVNSESNISDGHKGMGIGLSICKAIILAHGGQINARNHEDGAEFYFSLPKEDSTHELKNYDPSH